MDPKKYPGVVTSITINCNKRLFGAGTAYKAEELISDPDRIERAKQIAETLKADPALAYCLFRDLDPVTKEIRDNYSINSLFASYLLPGDTRSYLRGAAKHISQIIFERVTHIHWATANLETPIDRNVIYELKQHAIALRQIADAIRPPSPPKHQQPARRRGRPRKIIQAETIEDTGLTPSDPKNPEEN